MSRHRFRWTRAKFRKARSLARYFSRHIYDLPSDPPRLVQRLWDLYERHPQNDDPLETPFKWRPSVMAHTDGIPF